MKIFNPIKGYINKKSPKGSVTQWFGENIALYASINIGLTKGHNGIDVVAPWGTPMYAVEGGIVCEVKTDPSGYGMHLRFLTQTGEKTEREWTYGHCSAIFVKIGDIIKPGQLIANMGNTGFVVSDVNALGYWVKGSNKYSGTHLHLGCREIKYSKTGWRYNKLTPKFEVLNYDNGSLGAIDFADWFMETGGDMEIIKRDLEGNNKQRYASDDPEWWKNFLNLLAFLRGK